MGSSGEAVGLSDRIDLPGPKEPEAIAALMRLGLAFVQHSVTAMDGDSEGTPVAVWEAMASGSPLIAIRHTGITDVVEHGMNGGLRVYLARGYARCATSWTSPPWPGVCCA